MFKKFLAVIVTAAVLFAPFSAADYGVSAAPQGLADNIIIGYWENWVSGGSQVKLRETSPEWDVLIVSFMLTDSTNSHCVFSPDSSMYPNGNEAFKADVKFCQNRGQKVLIAFGGALGYSLELDTIEQRDDFFTSCRDIIEYYGFDGLDIDVEQSLINNEGETSMLNPTKPMNTNLIYICRALSEYFDDFILTMAPEHPYVQGGAYWWGGWQGIWGGYLPLIHGVRDILTFVHPQLYNNGFADYPIGYQQYDVETYIFVTELLIKGFDTPIGEHFDGLRPDQVALGVLTHTGEKSGNGELPAEDYAEILTALLTRYPDFRGAMTWSVGWDTRTGSKFLTLIREVIDAFSSHVPKPLKGDINFDGAVDGKDVALLTGHILAQNSLETGKQAEAADLNGGGEIDVFALVLLKQQLVSVHG